VIALFGQNKAQSLAVRLIPVGTYTCEPPLPPNQQPMIKGDGGI